MAPAQTVSSRYPHGIGHWLTVALGVVVLIFGLPILAGGLWLISLGGSWYYLFAGIGLVASGVFLLRTSLFGFWIYLATYLGTVVWAFWEAGFDWWAQVPRLVAPSVIMVLVLLCLPQLLHRGSKHQPVQKQNTDPHSQAA